MLDKTIAIFKIPFEKKKSIWRIAHDWNIKLEDMCYEMHETKYPKLVFFLLAVSYHLLIYNLMCLDW